MADFYSDRDINDAINRVRQMQEKADSYVPRPRKQATPTPKQQQASSPSPPKTSTLQNAPHADNMKNSPTKPSTNPISSLISSIFSGDSDKLLIMGLILLLSKEKGDQMLIMALLYILM